MLKPTVTQYKPKELEKLSGKKVFLRREMGYRSIKKGENLKEMATEIQGAVWHDRKLLETVICQPGERFTPRKKVKWHDKKKMQYVE